MKYLVCLALLLSFCSTSYAAGQGVTIVSIAAGSYQVDDTEHHLTGSRTAISLKYLYTKNWSWFSSLGSGSAQQIYLATDNRQYLLEANTTSLSGGVEYRKKLNKKGSIEPFVGLGLNAMSYQLDYTYPDSQVGQAKGTGFGPLFKLGSRFRLGKNFIIIPAYQYSSVSIQTESGDTRNIVSSGVFLGLVAAF